MDPNSGRIHTYGPDDDIPDEYLKITKAERRRLEQFPEDGPIRCSALNNMRSQKKQQARKRAKKHAARCAKLRAKRGKK